MIYYNIINIENIQYNILLSAIGKIYNKNYTQYKQYTHDKIRWHL